MQEAVPSRTAYRVALRRAAHQVFDSPVVFSDPFALRILNLQPGAGDLRAPRRPSSASLRAFLVARSLFAEETLAGAVEDRGVSQYVLLGAGLDTFALRNPHASLRIFEVDHPATQRWKQRLLHAAGLDLPPGSVHVPVDFETDDLHGRLQDAGLDFTRPALFALLGVVPYLSVEALRATLAVVEGHRAAAGVVLDYGLPRQALPPLEQLALDSLAQRVAQAGEPFRQLFTDEQMAMEMAGTGLHIDRLLGPAEINGCFFEGRGSGLRVLGLGARLLSAFSLKF